MEGIRLNFNNKVINGMPNEKFSISIGISQVTKGMSKETLFINADKSLYEAKRTGKNKTIIFK